MKKGKIFALLLSFMIAVAASAASAAPGTAKPEKIFDRDGDRIFENLRDRMQAADSDDFLPVVILYKEHTPVAGTFAVRLNQIRAEKIRHSYRHIPAVSVSLTTAQIEEVRKDPWVEHIEYDAPVKAAMSSAKQSFGVDAVRQQFGFTGNRDGIKGNYSKNDIVVAIADTGININHKDLQRKVLFWKDFHGSGANPYDDNGHGTMVAGVVLGAGKQKKTLAGVAPEAALVAFKVLDHAGSGAISNCIAAVDETIARRTEFNIRILNLSLAVSGTSSGRDAFSVATNRAVSAGIVVVVAAGNEGPDSETIGSPSAAAKVITVGAGADLGEKGFYIAKFSSRGPTADGRAKPDLWAPGVRIQTTAPGGYRSVNGTSFAAPFVTGVVALMLEANPSLSPAKVKSILLSSAEKWAPRGKSNEAGKGRLRAYEAITRAAAIQEGLNPPDVPTVAFLKSSLNANEVKAHTFPVTRLKNFIAITVVLYNAGAGIKMELLAPNGSVISQVTGFSRQEQLTVKPAVSGVYTIRLTGIGSSTPYLLDISADQN